MTAKRSFAASPGDAEKAFVSRFRRALRFLDFSPERIPFWFLALSLPLGIAYALCMGPLRVPDELGHFFRAYSLSKGVCVAKPASGAQVDWRELDRYLPWKELPPQTTPQDMVHMIDANGGTLPPSLVNNFMYVDQYSCILYIPAAVGIRIGRFFTNSGFTLLYLGRLVNLTVFCLAIFWALRLLPDFRLLLAGLALMPMTLHQAASLSADSVTIWGAFLVSAYVLSLAYEENALILARRQYVLLALGTVLLALSKADLSLVVLVILIPEARFPSRRARWMSAGCYALLGTLVSIAWYYVNRRNGDMLYAMSAANGVRIDENFRFMFLQPAVFLRAIGRTVALLRYEYVEEFIGRLGFLSIRLPVWLTWTYLGILVTIAVTQCERVRLSWQRRVFLVSVFFVYVGGLFVMTWGLAITQSYLGSEIRAGRGIVSGVMGRYFIPYAFLPFVALASITLRFPRKYVAAASLGFFLTANYIALGLVWDAYQRRTSTVPNRLRMAFETLFTDSGETASLRYRGRLVYNPYFDGPIYFVFEGSKHRGVNPEWMARHGYRWPDDVLIIPMSELATIPPGDPVYGGNRKLSRAGLYKNGLWILDIDGSHQFDDANPGGRASITFGGLPGDLPVVGDWNGDGRRKVGIYRHGLWMLDWDGDGIFTSADRTFSFGGSAGDLPVVGDWTGDGRAKIGVYRGGAWILDLNGNGTFEEGLDSVLHFGGVPNDVPVVGHWSGNGRKSQIGIYRKGLWLLDSNGNGQFDYTDSRDPDTVIHFGGLPGDVPVVGDWNGDGKPKLGVVRDGSGWLLDLTGDHQLRPGHVDFSFGSKDYIPLAGPWAPLY